MDLKQYKNIEFEDFSFDGNMPKLDEVRNLERLFRDRVAYTTDKDGEFTVSLQMVQDALNMAKHLHKFTEEEIFETLKEKFPERFV